MKSKNKWENWDQLEIKILHPALNSKLCFLSSRGRHRGGGGSKKKRRKITKRAYVGGGEAVSGSSNVKKR